MKITLGHVLLIVVVMALTLFSGHIAKAIWGYPFDVDAQITRQERLRAFRKSPGYLGHMQGLRAAHLKAERKRKRDERYQRKLDAKLAPALRRALEARRGK